MVLTVEEISPEQAKELVGNLMPNYRPLDENQVDMYADRMKTGQWRNGQERGAQEPLHIDEELGLVNGRRRLEAQVRAGVTCTFHVVRGRFDFLREVA